MKLGIAESRQKSQRKLAPVPLQPVSDTKCRTSVGGVSEYGELRDVIALPGQEGYAAGHTGFDQAVQQRPAMVLRAGTITDLIAGVKLAKADGLGVGVQATGHGLTVPADDGLLLNTGRLTSVRVDPSLRTAWLEPGVTWDTVIEAGAAYGLAPLCGAAPGVGAVSYTIGGGLGSLGRTFGYAADLVARIDLITADGELRSVTPGQHPDLFWGVRGGGGNFGVVAGLEIQLVAVSELYGGGLYFPGEAAGKVLPAFLDCLTDAPDELSLSLMVLRFPDLPALPAAIRGRHCCHVRVAYLGEREVAERHLGSLRRAADLLLDTVRLLPMREIGTIHGDPTLPHPVQSRSLVLRSIDEHLVQALLNHVGPDVPSVVELRHLGGALARPPAVDNCVGHRGGVLNVFTSAYPIVSQFPAAEVEQLALLEDLQPWSDGGALLNFLAGPHITPADVRAAFSEQDFERLRTIKAEWDPGNIFRFNQNIPPV